MFNIKMTDGYSLAQLQKLSGEPVRRIRSYIQQDLLPHPKQLGRNARYSKVTLTRLLAVKRLRTIEGLSITEVRTVLSNLNDSEIKDLSTDSPETGALNIEPARSRSKRIMESGQVSGSDSALEYLRRLKDKRRRPEWNLNAAHRLRSEEVHQRLEMSLESPALYAQFSIPDSEHLIDGETFQAEQSGSAVHRLISRLNQLAPASRIQRRARSEEWMKIPVTEDIQLHVRSGFGKQDRAALELLADYIREAMIGEV